MAGNLAWRKSGSPAFAASEKADVRVSSPRMGQAIPLLLSGI